MNRRELFRSAATATAAAGAGLLAADPEAVWGSGTKTDVAKGRPFAIPFIETRDRAGLFYRDWGTGKPVLFTHSLSVNSDLWQYQMVHLASQGLRCVAYDRRGHGRSIDPGRGYDFDTLADDLATVIEKLDLREITLVGHSMGCGEIVRYLLRHSSARITRVAMVSPSLPFALKTEDNPDGVDRSVVDQLNSQWSKDYPKWLGKNARPFFAPDTSAEMIDWGIRMCQQSSLHAILECNRIVMETDFRPELPKISVPTLIIHGDADVSAPIDFTGRKVAKLIPGSQFKVYERAPHGLMFTHTDRLNADLLSFIRG
jgi:non-heme chloroperoxidase